MTQPCRATRRLSRRALLLGSAVFVAAHDALAGNAVGPLLARVAQSRRQLRTLQGPFTQTRTIGLLATDVHSQGTLTVVCPDRLRWDLAPPDEVTFFVGPEGLAYRGPHGQARLPPSSARVAAGLQDVSTLLGGDLLSLRARWDLQVVRDDATGAELQATARPGTTAPLASIRFALAPDLVRPIRALLIEGPRDRTDVQFGAIVVNAPVDPTRMHL